MSESPIAPPAAIVGKAGRKTTEFYGALATLAIMIASLLFHKDISSQATLAADLGAALTSTGYALSRSITKNGVINGLAMQHAALVSAGTGMLDTAAALDPKLQPRVTTVEHDLADVKNALEQVQAVANKLAESPIAARVDPSMDAKLKGALKRIAALEALQP